MKPPAKNNMDPLPGGVASERKGLSSTTNGPMEDNLQRRKKRKQYSQTYDVVRATLFGKEQDTISIQRGHRDSQQIEWSKHYGNPKAASWRGHHARMKINPQVAAKPRVRAERLEESKRKYIKSCLGASRCEVSPKRCEKPPEPHGLVPKNKTK